MSNILPVPKTQLTPAESQSLKGFENVIRKGMIVFVDVGRALRAISNGRLYRAEFSTFADYLELKWQMHVSRAKQLMIASEIEDEVSPPQQTPTNLATNCSQIASGEPKTLIPNEGVARAIASSAPKGERKALFEEARETSPKDAWGNPKLTAAHVKETAEKRKSEEAEEVKDLEDAGAVDVDQVGHAITHDHNAAAFDAREDFTSLMRDLSELKKRFRSMADGAAGHYVWRHMQEWNAGVYNLHSIVRFAAPYAVCPYCGGERCAACNNRGWLPEEIYKAVPRDIRGGPNDS